MSGAQYCTSPCAPAFGCSERPANPVISHRSSMRPSIIFL